MYEHLQRISRLYNHEAYKIWERNSLAINKVMQTVPPSLFSSSSVVKSIGSPVIRDIQKQERLMHNILKNPVLKSIQSRDSIFKNVYDSPAIEAIRTHENFIQKVFNHPTINSFYQQQTAYKPVINSYNIIMKQHSSIYKPLFSNSRT